MPDSLYIHIPVCQAKCGYCDFYSVPLADCRTAPLVDALLAELRRRRHQIGPPLRTIFVGGGTPTVLPDGDLARLLRAIAELISADHLREFTVEANPATLTDSNAAILAAAGVNRVSIGAQSFHPPELALLERIHRPDDIPAAVRIARWAGITNVNLDLIYGIPGQTMHSWTESLRRALELEPDHLACYALTYEPQTPLTARRDQGRILACDEQLEADMMLACHDDLQAAGFEHYEISNYARWLPPHPSVKPETSNPQTPIPNCQSAIRNYEPHHHSLLSPGHSRRCLHNLCYWKNLPHVGIGPSAAGYTDGLRYKNLSDIGGYIRRMHEQGSAVAEQEALSPRRRAGETAMLRLRLLEGIDIREFEDQTGFDPLRLFSAPIKAHASAGCLAVDQTSIRLTLKGLLIGDIVMADFLDAAAAPPDPA